MQKQNRNLIDLGVSAGYKINNMKKGIEKGGNRIGRYEPERI